MSHKAAAGLEMSETPQQSLYVELLDSGDASNAKGAPQRPWPHLRDSLRPLRLQFINLVFDRFTSWKSNTEHRKVAMYRKRRVAASHILLQLFPLGGAIVLMILQWTKYWIGTQTSVSTFLQFVAKFHELMMQASLVEILLYVIRAELVNGYIPLGALTSATQATQLSYLWSLDFISTFKSPALKGWRKAVLPLVILIILPLTSLVGPSSAILMIPRPDTPHIIQENNWYLHNSTDDVFPSSLSRVNGLTVDLLNLNATVHTSRNKRDLGQITLFDMTASNKCNYSLEQSVRYSTFSNEAFSETNVTLPTCLSSRAFINVINAGNRDVNLIYEGVGNQTTYLRTLHPVVSTQCTYQSMSNSEDIFYVFKNRTLGALFNIQTLADRVSNFTGSSNATFRLPEKDDTGVLGRVFYPPIWVSSPEPRSNSLIGVFSFWEQSDRSDELPHSLPWVLAQPESYRSSLSVQSCTVSAYWNIGEVQMIQKSGGKVSQTGELAVLELHKARPITLDVSGIDTVQGPEFFRDIFNIDYIWNDLPILFALAIARIPMDGSDLRSEMPTDFSEHDTTVFKCTTFVYGYSYASRSTSVQLAIAVMIAYCVIAIAYSGYILITGSTSTAWNSTIELIALALQSKRPDHLGHIAVGLDSIETMKEGVGIRVNQDNELELIFAHDRDIDKRRLRKIQRNREYRGATGIC